MGRRGREEGGKDAPGATLASTIVTLRSGREVARWYAHERPALPAPMMMTSEIVRSYSVVKYLCTIHVSDSGRGDVRKDAPLDHGPRDLRLLDGREAVVAIVVLLAVVRSIRN